MIIRGLIGKSLEAKLAVYWVSVCFSRNRTRVWRRYLLSRDRCPWRPLVLPPALGIRVIHARSVGQSPASTCVKKRDPTRYRCCSALSAARVGRNCTGKARAKHQGISGISPYCRDGGYGEAFARGVMGGFIEAIGDLAPVASKASVAIRMTSRNSCYSPARTAAISTAGSAVHSIWESRAGWRFAGNLGARLALFL